MTRFVRVLEHVCLNGETVPEARYKCRECERARQRAKQQHPVNQARLARDRDKIALSNRRTKLKKYGLTPESYQEKLEAQGGCCAICGIAAEDFAEKHPQKNNMPVDHNHKTGVTRGVLCDTCNRVLGLFNDSPERLEAAARYLRSYMR